MEKAAFEKIYADLKAGYSYGFDFTWNHYNNKPMRYPFFDTVIFYDPIKNLFRWTHYGSSANKATKKELKWLISGQKDCMETRRLERHTAISAQIAMASGSFSRFKQFPAFCKV